MKFGRGTSYFEKITPKCVEFPCRRRFRFGQRRLPVRFGAHTAVSPAQRSQHVRHRDAPSSMSPVPPQNPSRLHATQLPSLPEADERHSNDGGGVECRADSALFSMSSGGTSTTTTAAALAPIMVSHVPPSKVSVAETNSTESSLASEQCVAACHSTIRNSAGREAACSAPPPPRDSSDQESGRGERISAQIALVTNVSRAVLAPPSLALEERAAAMAGRKVSLGEEGEGPATAAKKPRLQQALVSNSDAAAASASAVVRAIPPPLHQPIAPRPSLLSSESTPTVLLAQPGDAAVLSPLHVFVREQVEVFTATSADIAQPAPGRKNRIQLHQVGLRCIHCRDSAPRDRVKRAVCYPSGVGRVYHSVSDMKFDHFAHCKGRPVPIKAQFQNLKDDCKQKRHKRSTSGCSPKIPSYSSSSTAQYYHDSAREMGMVNGNGGLFMANDVHGFRRQRELGPPGGAPAVDEPTPVADGAAGTTADIVAPILPKASASSGPAPKLAGNGGTQPLQFGSGAFATHHHHAFGTINDGQSSSSSSSVQNNVLMSSLASFLYSLNSATTTTTTSPTGGSASSAMAAAAAAIPSTAAAAGGIGAVLSCHLLTSSTDEHHLNPLHCFVRRHIELFVADPDDIAAPAPGRKTRVVLGQVGLRCIHCARLPPKDRVKRAVCYPAAVAGIYHSVSNMKFDHFDKCRGLPEPERAIFTKLRSSCGRHGPRAGKGLGGIMNNDNNSVSNANSTAQYYHDSAARLGLVDSDTGIRFAQRAVDAVAGNKGQAAMGVDDYAVLGNNNNNIGPTDGISALMIAASVRAASAAREEMV